jgi:hypothetical protein
MGFLDSVLGLIFGEDEETKVARKKMVEDAKDPRKRFVFGVLSISYKVDPGYLPQHAKTAVTEWYGIKSPADLEAINFGVAQHPGYNLYRKCFLARAGFGAGMIDDAKSWALALAEGRKVQQAFGSWDEYGRSYLAGHLAYRAAEGDSPQRLAEIEASTNKRIAEIAKEVWAGVPFGTPL